MCNHVPDFLWLQSIEATDDDHQIDDVFVQRASTKQSDAKQEQRDHMMAVKGKDLYLVVVE